jgi:hypothetical protein
MNKLRSELKEYHLTGYGAQRAEVYKPSLTIRHEETDQMQAQAFGYAQGYLLKATIGVNFWANQAQFQDAYRNAEKTLMTAMYGDVLSSLDLIRSALYAHDIESALVFIDGLEKHLQEVP